MEGLGWEGVDSSYLWSNVYQPYLNYSAAINSSPPPFSDNSAEYSTLIANNGVGQPSIIAPTTIWQQNNTVQTLGTDPVNDSRLQQHGGLNGVLSVKSSIDSLDCLLSTTNSNTDTSIDDEGGVISSPMSFWNFKSVSSKELEGSNNNGGDEKGKGKDGSRKRSLSRIDDVDTKEGSFKVISQPKSKRFHLAATTSSTISFQLSPTSSIDQAEPDQEAIAQMKEMIYRAAAFRPVNLAPEVVEKPKRKNVRTSSDPQTVAARQRRERISDRIRVLQRIVPGGTKMDTASMLDEAANYLKFLQTQIKALENLGPKFVDPSLPINTNCNLLSFSSIPFIHSLLGPVEGHIPFL